MKIPESVLQKLPPSILVKHQEVKFQKEFAGRQGPARIIVTIRHDDRCGNGRNMFSVTGEMYDRGWRTSDGKTHWPRSPWMCGCLHDEIGDHFPELVPYIKWHGTFTDGPTHYLANTLYHAGERDCFGKLKTDVKSWVFNIRKADGGLVLPEDNLNHLLGKPDAERIAAGIGGEIVPIPYEYHEGKARDLEAAREAAVWPEATDEELSVSREALTQALLDRLPALMVEFKAAVESLGLVY